MKSEQTLDARRSGVRLEPVPAVVPQPKFAMASLCAAVTACALFASAAHAAPQITRTSSFDYDPVSGLLIKEVIEPNSPDHCLVTTYLHDSYGRRRSATTRNCNGSAAAFPGGFAEAAAPSAAAAFTPRTSESTFTADQRFVATSTVAVGQPEAQAETKTYDSRFGVVKTLIGPNGLTTKWYYDEFGRKIREMRADNNGTQWSYDYCSGVNGGTLSCPTIGGKKPAYALTVTPIRFISESSWNLAGPYSSVYHDLAGRKIRSETQGSNVSGTSTLVYQDTIYNALGQVSQTSLPYYAGQTTVYWTSYVYDTLGRVTDVNSPNDAGTAPVNTHTEYDGLVTTTRDPLLHTVKQERDIEGNVVKVTDAINGVLTREYDSYGNLVKTIDPLGNVVQITYDVRGRKSSMNDPDMGVWGYCYDALGQLKAQQSPKIRGSNALASCPSNTGTGKTAVTNLPAWTVMAYDNLGRMTQRIEASATSTWSYDTYANNSACAMGKGKLCEVTGANAYVRKHVYDTLGRISSTTSTIGTSFTASVTYDALGRVDVLTYPSGLAVRNVYTPLRGDLKQVIDQRTSQPLWTADAVDSLGNLTQYTYGSGTGTVVTTNQFYPGTGRLNITRAGAGNSVQNLMHTYDDAGKLKTRVDVITGVTASYVYDDINRLKTETRSGGGLSAAQVMSWTYDSIGNMRTRTESGATHTYNYNASGAGSLRPHAVASVTGSVNGVNGPIYDYDLNGNLTSGAGRSVQWFSFDKVSSITKGTTRLEYLYDAEYQRSRESYFLNNVLQRTTVYLNAGGGAGLFYEQETGVAGTKKKHYISAGGATIGMIVCTVDPCTNVANTSTQYWHRDHLGSTSVVTNAAGAVVERLAYEPFGKRRNSNGVTDPNGTLTPTSTDRGYTGHEHLDEVSLVNMNGRIYDPGLGRFMSADPIIQGPGNLQSYNRYSYGWNSPLNGIDPSGYGWLKDRWNDVRGAGNSVLKLTFDVWHAIPGHAAIDRYIMNHQWAYTVASIAASYYGGPGGAALFSSYYTYQATGDINAAVKAGAVSLGTAMAFSAVGDMTTTPGSVEHGIFTEGTVNGPANVLGHAVVGCASAAAGGGSCRSGAMAASVGSGFTNYGPKTSSLGVPGNLAVQALLGGTASVLGGGKFANGAQTAAMGYLFNYLRHCASTGECMRREGYIHTDNRDGSFCNIQRGDGACGYPGTVSPPSAPDEPGPPLLENLVRSGLPVTSAPFVRDPIGGSIQSQVIWGLDVVGPLRDASIGTAGYLGGRGADFGTMLMVRQYAEFVFRMPIPSVDQSFPSYPRCGQGGGC
jgi:RHS repeat-associated protein